MLSSRTSLMIPDSPLVECWIIDAGGGHRASYNALVPSIARVFPSWRLVDRSLQEVLAGVDLASRADENLFKPIAERIHKLRFGDDFPFERKPRGSEDIYNFALRHNLTFGSRAVLRALQYGIEHYKPEIKDAIKRHWLSVEKRPDIILALIPNHLAPLSEAAKEMLPGVPLITMMTDLIDYPRRTKPGVPSRFWLSIPNRYVIVGSEEAERQALTAGYPRAHVKNMGGMLLGEDFYKKFDEDRGTARQNLGGQLGFEIRLEPDRVTGMLNHGGAGSKEQLDMAAQLKKAAAQLSRPTQLIVMCGKNESVHRELIQLELEEIAKRGDLERRGKLRKLKRMQPYTPCLPVPHTFKLEKGPLSNMARYYWMADYAGCKPGPGSMSEMWREALAVLTVDRKIMPQEKGNVHIVEKERLGYIMPNYGHFAEMVQVLLKPGNLEATQHRAREFGAKNEAFYKVPYLINEFAEMHARLIEAGPANPHAAFAPPKHTGMSSYIGL